MNTSYYADINSIINTFYLSEEEADRIINELEDYDEEEFENDEWEEEEEDDYFFM
jgi:argininosuccinate lyase